MVYTFLDKKAFDRPTMFANKSAIKNEIMYNKELAAELHKPIIRKFKKRKRCSAFIDSI